MKSVGRGRDCFPGSKFSLLHGIPAYLDGFHLRYSDNNEQATPENVRDCPKCGLNPKDFNGHDPCIADLPGVRNACCGHGVEPGFIQFDNGMFIEGSFKIFNSPAGKEWNPSSEDDAHP